MCIVNYLCHQVKVGGSLFFYIKAPPLSHQTLAPTGTDGFLIEEGNKNTTHQAISIIPKTMRFSALTFKVQ